MKIGILGSGIVGQTLGRTLSGLGHDVLLGTRDPHDLDRPRGAGVGSLRAWLDGSGEGAAVSTFEAAAQHGALVVNAVAGPVAVEVFQGVGTDALDGKVLIDVSNAVDLSRGWPPTVFASATDSISEGLQRALPTARVVKTLNTMNAAVIVDPALAGGDSTVFISGDDEAAKAQVAALLRELGWTDIFDLGDLSTARGTELLLPLFLSIGAKLGHYHLNFKLVR